MRRWTWVCAVGLTLSAGAARAQAPSGVAVSGSWLRPQLELRTRADLFAPSVEIGQPSVPVLATLPTALAGPEDAWVLHERTRVGLVADRGVLSAAVLLQDARLWGVPSPQAIDRSDAGTSVHVAYLEAHTAESRGTFARVGRQEITWGDGRLLGVSSFSPTPRSLDAARARIEIGIFDIEALASILSPPGTVPSTYPDASAGGGSGAQLYGLDIAAHIDPLLGAELYGLARIARDPLPATLRPSDTYVTSLRLFGAWDEWSYALEGALELGRIEVFAAHRRLVAGAATARVSWQPDAPLEPKMSISGSYASGDDGGSAGTMHRFDPILPDDRAGLGQMGLYAWTNLVEGAATASVTPFEDAAWSLGYHFVRLADPSGPWYSASLALVGRDDTRTSGMLGHEVSTALTYTVAPGLEIALGYGAFFTGRKARAILATSTETAPKVMHAAYLQATLSAP